MWRVKMPLLSVVALVGVVGLASAARFTASSETISGNNARDFDYFVFVRQWPGRTCSNRACPLLHDLGLHFTVHGLWPNYYNGTWPQFCDDSRPFTTLQVADLVGPLEAEWPDLVKGSDEEFWDHEWSKHGTCALSVLPDEHSYFARILQLHWRFDLAAAFRQANILPSTDQMYGKQQLVDAVYDMYGVKPVVRCSNNELSEMWMCFNKQLRPFSCDPAMHSDTSCGQVVALPPLPYPTPPDDQAAAGDAGGNDGSGDGARDRPHSSRRRLRGLTQERSWNVATSVVQPETTGYSAAGGNRDDVSAVLTSLSSLDATRAAAAARQLRVEVLGESSGPLHQIGSAAAGKWGASHLHPHHWSNAATLTSSSTWGEQRPQQRPKARTAGALSNLVAAVRQRLRWPLLPYTAARLPPPLASGDTDEAEEVPNGGASVKGWADARRDLVWRSKLREPDLEDDSSRWLAGLAVVTANEDGGATAAAAAGDPWASELLGGSLAMHPGGGGVGPGGAPVWVVVLVVSQHVCVAVIAVSLAVLAGVSLVGAVRSLRQRRRWRQGGGGDRTTPLGRQQWRMSGGKGGLEVPYVSSPLKEPLLPGSPAPSPLGRGKRREGPGSVPVLVGECGPCTTHLTSPTAIMAASSGVPPS